MKAVILAGGFGTRISEESENKPKPMIEIGGKPIIWHIMKIYSAHGINEFVICGGYKHYVIKEYFANYSLHQSDVTFDMALNTMEIHHQRTEPWRVTLVDTGERTMTGGRLARISKYVESEDAFCMTYGDGLSDVNLGELVKFHEGHGRLATLTAVTPPGRFGALEKMGSKIIEFKEKPNGDGAHVNGGFFVLSPKVLKLIGGDECVWESDPLVTLAKEGELMAYEHDGFWQPMDTLRDKNYLEKLWQDNRAPWRKW